MYTKTQSARGKHTVRNSQVKAGHKSKKQCYHVPEGNSRGFPEMASQQLTAASACSQPAQLRLAAVLCPHSCRGAQPLPPPAGGTPRCHPQPAPTQPWTLPTRGMLQTSSCQVSAPARADSGTGRPPQGSCMGGGHALCPSSAPALPSALAAGPGCFAIPSHPIPSPPHPTSSGSSLVWAEPCRAGRAGSQSGKCLSCQQPPQPPRINAPNHADTSEWGSTGGLLLV